MLIRRLLTPFRFCIVLSQMFVFIAQMSVIWLLVRGHWNRVRWSNIILAKHCRVGLWLLNIKVKPIGLENLASLEGAFFVGNHLSYIDVLVIHSVVPACFVTSKEVRETPVLGQVCALAGCLFVERRSKLNIKSEVVQITEGLVEKLNVAVFPEATSTNGEKILRFKRPLFLGPINATKPVVPFCLNYRTVGQAPINVITRDKIFWYGDMPFASHLWALAGSGGVTVELNFMAAIQPTPIDDATSLSEQSQAIVESVFIPVAGNSASARDNRNET